MSSNSSIQIFNTPIQIKKFSCERNGSDRVPESPSVSLYVRMTNTCTTNCKFCTFHGRAEHLNVPKFITAIREIRSKVKIKKISFTGGEPTFERDLLDLCLFAVKNLDSTIFTVVNSNGHNLKDFPIDLVDSLAISKHHYNCDKDAEIFQRSREESSNVDKLIETYPTDRLHLSCTMTKGFIDSPEEVYNYLSYYASKGVFDFGFVSLMPTCKFAKDNYINALEILSKLPNTIIANTWRKLEKTNPVCHCSNFLTNVHGGMLVSSYARETLDTRACDSILVFDINQLKQGFGGPVIF